MSLAALSALLVAGFVLVHVFIGRLSLLDVVPRSGWLSFAGGTAVAYVFLHILPELSAHQQTFAEGLGVGAQTAEAAVYLVALVGLGAFYGLERMAKLSRARSRARTGDDRVEAEMFWLHIGAFGLYNLLIGYLLLNREETGVGSLLLYFAAMALHFVTTDFGLRQDHKDRYDSAGRWLLAAGVVIGWGIGLAATLPEIVIGFLFAFLAGGVVLNVLKEELPEERESRFWPFALGAVAYGGLAVV